MLLIARWLVKLIPFFDFDYLVPLGYKNQENCKIAGKYFKIKYHVTHCTCIMIRPDVSLVPRPTLAVADGLHHRYARNVVALYNAYVRLGLGTRLA